LIPVTLSNSVRLFRASTAFPSTRIGVVCDLSLIHGWTAALFETAAIVAMRL